MNPLFQLIDRIPSSEDEAASSYVAEFEGIVKSSPHLLHTERSVEEDDKQDFATIYCARVGNLLALRTCVRLGGDVRRRNKNGDGGDCLFIAAQEGHLLCCEFLVKECKADVNSLRPTDNVSPLFMAAQEKKPAVVEFLIKGGARVSHVVGANVADDIHTTALYIAAEVNCLESVRLLVELGKANVEDGGDDDNVSPLYIAAQNGNDEVCEYLINEGADLERKKKRVASTPLYIAAQQGNVSTCRLLLSYGANPNVRTSNDWTPLRIAVANDHLEVFMTLLDANADCNNRHCNLFCEAIQTERPCEYIRLLLATGRCRVNRSLADTRYSLVVQGTPKTVVEYYSLIQVRGYERIIEQLVAVGARVDGVEGEAMRFLRHEYDLQRATLSLYSSALLTFVLRTSPFMNLLILQSIAEGGADEQRLSFLSSAERVRICCCAFVSRHVRLQRAYDSHHAPFSMLVNRRNRMPPPSALPVAPDATAAFLLRTTQIEFNELYKFL